MRCTEIVSVGWMRAVVAQRVWDLSWVRNGVQWKMEGRTLGRGRQ
jgi:hypothetical protein